MSVNNILILIGVVIIAIIIVISIDLIDTSVEAQDTCHLVTKIVLPDSCEGECEATGGDCATTSTRGYGCVKIPFDGRKCAGEQAASCACSWTIP